VRLDHLLSKEHVASRGFARGVQVRCFAGVCPVAAMLSSGTSIIWLACWLSVSVQPVVLAVVGVVGVEPRGWGWVGQAHCWVLRDRASRFLGSGRSLVRVGVLVGGAARCLRTTQWTRASL
jgi:hypothetical protein